MSGLRLMLLSQIANVPWLIAAVGWTASWNAYTNLTFTLGGVVLWAVWLSIVASEDSA